MSNPYLTYFDNQVQSGGALTGFQGVRIQRGRGFWGNLFSGVKDFFVKTLLPEAGKSVIPSALGLAQDVISGENVGAATKRRLSEAGRNVANTTLDTIKAKLSQSGSGIRMRTMRRKRLRFSRSLGKKRKSNKRKRRKSF